MDASFKFRTLIVCVVLVTGLTALSYRLTVLQVFDRKLSTSQTIPRFKSHQKIVAHRGLIVDRNHSIIAQNRPQAALIADLHHLKTYSILTRAVAHRYASQMSGWKELDQAERRAHLAKTRRAVVGQLSQEEVVKEHLAYATEIIGRELRIPSEELLAKVKSGSARIVVKKNIREDLARRIENELQKRRIQGFSFERSQRRYYPMPTLAPHLLGNTNYQGIGESGLEKSMQDFLAGRDGEREMKRDENGLVNLVEAAQVIPPKMGKHVKVTLDMGIQAIVEEELGMACQAYRAKKGSIIVVDPKNGDLLAIASRPHFHLNTRDNYAENGSSFAVSAQYEAGSVMKIVAMAAALDCGAARRDTVVDCGWGLLKRRGFTVRDPHRYNELSFDDVLVKSSNTGVFQFAELVGQPQFYQYLDRFGFGRRSGISVPGEAKGRIQDRRNARNFASATYGYGVSVTPLQLAMAYSALANGGTLLQPRIVQSIVANNGTILEEVPVKKVGRVISERAAREMCLSLEQVVIRGTGRRAKVPGYRAGGKTGTAEKWNSELGRYDETKKYLTFAGILPVHAPRFVCIVTIDEPSGLSEEFQIGGGSIAAPVFSQVSGRIARFMNLTPESDGPIALNPKQ